MGQRVVRDAPLPKKSMSLTVWSPSAFCRTGGYGSKFADRHLPGGGLGYVETDPQWPLSSRLPKGS
jgi:hypothetical protein